MKKYERLTIRNADGVPRVKCAVCDIQDKCDFTKESCCQELQDRLAELEDKIENGTIKEVVKADLSIIEYEYFTCLNCNYFIWNGADSTAQAKAMLANGEYPNYCPNCGARLKELRGE